MNILIVIEKNSWAEWHIANGFKKMGHTVSCFYFGDYAGEFYGYQRRNEQIKKNRILVDTAKRLRDESGLDLIFCYVYDDFLLPQYAKKLSDLGVPMVNYNVDMSVRWYRQIRTACYFDLMLCAQPDNMENLARYSKKVFYFPMAATPCQLNGDFLLGEKKLEVTFLGTAILYRRRMLSALANASVSLSVFGKYWDMTESEAKVCIRSTQKTLSDIIHYGWPRFRAEGCGVMLNEFAKRFFSESKSNAEIFIPPEMIKGKLANEELSTIFRYSKINVGLTRLSVENPNCVGRCQMRLRDFEVPMTGGFYLVEKSPGYDQAFVDGKEVVMWQTLSELLEKIHYYLKHENEREEIAAAGKQRALRDHTWESRFKGLFTELRLQNVEN